VPASADQVEVCVDINDEFDGYPASLTFLAVEQNNTSNNHQFTLELAQAQSDQCATLLFSDIPDASTTLITVTQADSVTFLQGSVMEVFQGSLNVAPTLILSASQAGVTTKRFIKDQGNIEISVLTNDLEGDSVILDWSGSDSGLVDLDGDLNDASMTVDPSLLDVGVYTVKVGAVQAGSLALPTVSELSFKLAESGALELDADLDGVADSLELGLSSNELAFSTSDTALVTQSGTKAVLGDLSFDEGIESLVVDYEVFDRWQDSGVSNFASIDKVINFSIEGLGIRGAQALAVVKLDAPLASDKTLYKFRNGNWLGFGFNGGDNYYSSVADAQGNCPVLDETLYTEGLLQGNDCILLKITDGGVNDFDGVANGIIKDPAGLANRSSGSSSSSSADEDRVPKMTGGSFGVFTLFVLFSLVIRRLYIKK